MGGDIDVLVAGNGVIAGADAAARLKGLRKVLLAEADELAERLAEPLCDIIVDLAGGYDAPVAPATSMGKNVMARVAALLDVMQVSHVRSMQTMPARPCSPPTPRGSDVAHGLLSGCPGGGLGFRRDGAFPASWRTSSHSDRPKLTSAKIIISGGGALGSAENFQEVIVAVAGWPA